MKMVKSLLLGSAAGLIAVAGAQAADLPVKAKPVEYVKICSLYGDGFFYIPGTDTCIKIGGWVRFEFNSHSTGSAAPQFAGAAGNSTAATYPDYYMRARFITSVDVRTQTQYGVLRAYTRAGFELSSSLANQGAFYTERAFIQFAGFTVGKTVSFFDFFHGVFGYGYGYVGGGSLTSGGGILLAAYTAQLGNGLTATLSIEDNTQRRNALWDATNDRAAAPLALNALAIGNLPGPSGYGSGGYPTCGLQNVGIEQAAAVPAGAQAPITFLGCPTGDYAAQSIPDIVGALRVDQAWGSAQLAAAMHQVRGSYYGHNSNGADETYTGVRPDDKWGYAVMGGVVLNLPWAQGDKFHIEATYSNGAPSYNGLSINGVNAFFNKFSGGRVANGWVLDGVFSNEALGANGVANGATGIQLTTAWSISAALEHYWTPALRSSLFGTYNNVNYNAVASQLICGPSGPYRTAAGAVGGQAGTAANLANSGCNPDFTVFSIGSRTVWNPVRNLDLGIEVMYSQINDGSSDNVRYNYGGANGRKAGLYIPSDEGIWSVATRWQRNFWP